jgi:hypothetical protein
MKAPSGAAYSDAAPTELEKLAKHEYKYIAPTALDANPSRLDGDAGDVAPLTHLRVGHAVISPFRKSSSQLTSTARNFDKAQCFRIFYANWMPPGSCKYASGDKWRKPGSRKCPFYDRWRRLRSCICSKWN